MASMTDGYPFVFTMYDRNSDIDALEYTLQYRFKSERSKHTYIVRVERYKSHTYCVKFFDKAHTDSKNKFSLRTNTFEARTIFYTLYHILLDVLQKDSSASFFFIGAEDEKDESTAATRRYQVYRRFVMSTISDHLFEHYRVNELSLYILVNRQYVNDKQTFVEQITEGVRLLYNND
ncbi:MAG: hypothetical protein J6C15_06795 [Bacteroidaceae bacterium]|nr:hypothetical protein [Bacteroidaceae bacterium]